MRGKKCALGVELDILHETGASILRDGVTKVVGGGLLAELKGQKFSNTHMGSCPTERAETQGRQWWSW